MNAVQALIEALESLSANKLRSGLTILGIVIGVAAVIAMLSIGQGAQNSVTGSIEGIGTNLLFVMQTRSEDVRNPKPLTMADADALSDSLNAPSLAAVAPILQGNVDAAVGSEKSSVTVSGVTPVYAGVMNETLTEGEFINQDHMLGRASVAVIGPDTATNLFGSEFGVVGETLRVNGQPFRVIGVLKSKGGSGFGNQDDRILVPITTAQTRLIHRETRNQVDMIYTQSVSAEATAQAQEEIATILRSRHNTGLNADDFSIYSQQDFLATAQTITGVFTIFLGGIAAISLLVGGIGIMNIMLVSVTERTREIGLRKALGARKEDILVQFLSESAVLSLLGGVVGIGLGWLISFVVGQVASASGTPINPAVGLDTILLATAFSTAIGLFFGLYPANRAASLQPVEALRYE